ncbi:hypothetical protein [Paenibacillus sp. N3.4]|uniref:hypothetical protein n=1 Tax=Paenibacillus sp. N3.4 TaxID=2603222 RepID=UPI0011CB44A2|nr:hypothetical protein [Paenibacillus sp. N3.4]TXK76913.1 hypothetical protein FU659_24355 [Paenibacillus sp. N3.4]
MQINLFVKKNMTLLIFCFSYCLLFLYHRYFSFIDEADNILGALSIVKGQDIYSGFISQHVPFVYYFTAIFALFGVKEYETFRLCMSFAILAIWILMYINYSGFFGKKSFRIFIVIYSLTIPLHWGNMILSDVFEGFALLVLLLEFIKFTEIKKMTIKSFIVISCCIFVSITSAFVSVYPIFIIFISFVLYELFKGEKKVKIDYKQYISFSIIILLPFCILIAYYYFTNNLSNFYFQSYQFNRIYYSKYLGGLGDNALQTLKQIPTNWMSYIANTLLTFTKENIIHSLFIVFNLIFVIKTFREKKFLSIVVFVYLGFTGVRGYTDFHAAPYYFISLFIISMLLNEYINNTKATEDNYKFSIKILSILFFIIIIANYLPNAGTNITKPIGTMSTSSYDGYIQKLTEKEDVIWYSPIYPQAYIVNHRKPASKVYCLVPWMAEAFTDQIINDLQSTKPKMIIFDKDGDVWGYKNIIYASEIYNFILSNYTVLNQFDSKKKIYIFGMIT